MNVILASVNSKRNTFYFTLLFRNVNIPAHFIVGYCLLLLRLLMHVDKLTAIIFCIVIYTIDCHLIVASLADLVARAEALGLVVPKYAIIIVLVAPAKLILTYFGANLSDSLVEIPITNARMWLNISDLGCEEGAEVREK